MIAKWIIQHTLIELQIKFTRVKSRLYSEIDDNKAKKLFTKIYNKVFEPALKPLTRIKLDGVGSCSKYNAADIAQAQISFKVENWSNDYDNFKTIYVLTLSTTNQDVLLFQHPCDYLRCV